VTGEDHWPTSHVALRFHYYRNLDVDRQALGSLVGFEGWTAIENRLDNQTLESLIKGNLGDRDTFSHGGQTYDLVEGQLEKNNWASRRVLLRNRREPAKFAALDIRTKNRSKSFANPTATLIDLPDGRPGVVVTLFIPGEGAAQGEGGQLIYAKPLP
jgi:hypothetical protein